MSHGYYDPETVDPYGEGYGLPARKKPYLLWGLIAAIVAGGGCCVLSCIPLAFFGFSLITNGVRDGVRNVPAFRAEIGELETIKMKVVKSGNDNDDEAWFFDVSGDKGSGELWARVEPHNGGQRVVEARLTMSDGRKVEIISR